MKMQYPILHEIKPMAFVAIYNWRQTYLHNDSAFGLQPKLPPTNFLLIDLMSTMFLLGIMASSDVHEIIARESGNGIWTICTP